MKKILLFFIGVLLSFQNFAQDPELFQTWYLYDMFLDVGLLTVADYDPPITPTLTILPTLEFNGLGACNTFQGLFIFLPTNELSVENPSHTNTVCGFDQDQFEDFYFDFFHDMQIMYYTIENDPDGHQTLFLESSIFNLSRFRNVPILSTPEFSLSKISLYPNPTSGTLFITSGGITIEKIKVYSISGQIILASENITNSIDVSRLSEGLYFLEIFSSEGNAVQKFIKK